ncbi:hypothetical protein Q7P36_002864 [Cladosporium allicinum]
MAGPKSMSACKGSLFQHLSSSTAFPTSPVFSDQEPARSTPASAAQHTSVSSPARSRRSSVASAPSERELSVDISTLTVLEKRAHTMCLNKEKKEALKESQKTAQDGKAAKKALVDASIMRRNEVSDRSEDKTPRAETPAPKKRNVGYITRSNPAKTSSRTAAKLKGLTKAQAEGAEGTSSVRDDSEEEADNVTKTPKRKTRSLAKKATPRKLTFQQLEDASLNGPFSGKVLVVKGDDVKALVKHSILVARTALAIIAFQAWERAVRTGDEEAMPHKPRATTGVSSGFDSTLALPYLQSIASSLSSLVELRCLDVRTCIIDDLRCDGVDIDGDNLEDYETGDAKGVLSRIGLRSKTKKYDVIVNGSSEEEFEGDGEAEVEG